MLGPQSPPRRLRRLQLHPFPQILGRRCNPRRRSPSSPFPRPLLRLRSPFPLFQTCPNSPSPNICSSPPQILPSIPNLSLRYLHSPLSSNSNLEIKTPIKRHLLPHLHLVISSACSWTCLLKAKGNDDDDGEYLSHMAHLFFSVDWRNRMRPPPPANYFGNCLGCPCFVKASVGDIIDEKDDFFMVCKAIGKAIEGIGDDIYKEMDGVIEKVMKVLPHKPLSIAGSPKLRVYDCDFGWGKPEKVEVTSIGSTGAISMAEGREDEGGVEIGVDLPESEIIKFGKHFDKFLGKCDC